MADTSSGWLYNQYQANCVKLRYVLGAVNGTAASDGQSRFQEKTEKEMGLVCALNNQWAEHHGIYSPISDPMSGAEIANKWGKTQDQINSFASQIKREAKYESPNHLYLGESTKARSAMEELSSFASFNAESSSMDKNAGKALGHAKRECTEAGNTVSSDESRLGSPEDLRQFVPDSCKEILNGWDSAMKTCRQAGSSIDSTRRRLEREFNSLKSELG